MVRVRRAFSRYISPRLADRILSDVEEEGAPFRQGAQRVSVVALFADLRGFTRLTESTQVDEVVALLNDYFTVITEAAYRHDATIFSMAGDNLLVAFNVPLPQPDAALLAWQTAHDMARSVKPVLERWSARAHGLAGDAQGGHKRRGSSRGQRPAQHNGGDQALGEDLRQQAQAAPDQWCPPGWRQ